MAITERDEYVVEEAGTRKVLAHNLNKRQLMEFVWTHDGRDYYVRPRMGAVVDDMGRDTGAAYQLADMFGREWNVYFKNGADHPWRKSRITAYGANEREAVLNLLEEGFRRAGWPDSFHVRLQGTTDIRDLGFDMTPSAERRAAAGLC
ncbi:hypothetical protein G4G28_09805 [Massilia sp. Dwa41.01b]|uniref:hypothetical protein n=1 Tax=Massilia sp. Dwa41.01b TaxID=2709302 RepID=UPI0016013AD9|nr:hypothetical protein [Massilia sp. Dwa41.01b]QNA88712.1 hypothetical protein G4G28_09805 [Massilia sp. Dwa41.01b]QNA99611.1 hypothetical protein G4G31_13480 [Massilia sp. Se16.2.3]